MNIKNLMGKNWIKMKGKNINILREQGNMVLENLSDHDEFVIYPELRKFTEEEIKIEFLGEILEGKPCTLKMLNRHKTILAEVLLNSEAVISRNMTKYYIFCILVPAKSKMKITKMDVKDSADLDEMYKDFFQGDTLLITPGYPSFGNKYMMGFVHTRVKAYQKLEWNVDVACISEYPNISVYEYEGIKVFKANYFHLREILRRKKYTKILIHFFDDRYANVLDSINLTETRLYFYLHGAETLYWDWEKLASPYFGDKVLINDELRKRFQRKDEVIRKYNRIPNAKWFFVTNWTKTRSEELVGIHYNNYDVIPCLIDTDLFYYEKKSPELRKKIFILRKFDDVNSYSLDLDVRIILELSRRPFFNDLEFDIYGDGCMFERILKPLEQFENIHFHKTFLSHDEIKKMHSQHGIALFATRFDSQAVSSCEAASSGCVVVSSDIPGVRQLFPKEANIMCETENYIEYADVIERLYYNPDEFEKLGKVLSDSVQSKFDYEHTIQKELDIFKREELQETYKGLVLEKQVEQPILTVIIPSYNVEKYLVHGVMSLLNQPNAHKLEILIVNDGSKDRTAEIGAALEKMTTIEGKPIVRLINKENGGHGSTINLGIELARGKYTKVLDGDDTVDSLEFSKLIDLLEKEDVDIVLNDYIEDFEHTNETNVVRNYSFMMPGIKYYFDDLCYEDYGFKEWGPILACSSYRTEMLKKANFKLSEKMFYVDMELNTYIAVACKTLKYYPLNVYRYLLGRPGQSVNFDSYIRNYKHHENVTINMINILKANEDKISSNKKKYMIEKLILPMISTQYLVVIERFKNRHSFLEFEERLKKYPEFYENPRIKLRKVRFHRKTRGLLIRYHSLLVKLRLKLKMK